MSRLKHFIAVRANRDDGVTGRFFDGRFACKKVESLRHLLSLMIYVDLNLIRAGLADTPEDSRYSGAYQRILGLRQRKRYRKQRARRTTRSDKMSGQGFVGRKRYVDEWLSPIQFREDASKGDTSPKPDRIVLERARASDRGCLPMGPKKYLELLDWTGRRISGKKRGRIPTGIPPILKRLGLESPEAWLEELQQYEDMHVGRFSAAVNQSAESELWRPIDQREFNVREALQ